MKKSILMALAIIGILGSCATLAVATPITDLGTIDYKNTWSNSIENDTMPGNVSLVFVYSEMKESSLITEKWYTENVTKYKFTTSKTYVDWWFTPSIQKFIYIDENTNDLYQVNINYTLIDIPENPYEERHQQLIENYTLILNDYNLTNESLANITLQFNELDDAYGLIMQHFNMTKRNYLNATENLTNLTADFVILEDDYNTTYDLWEIAVNNTTHYQTQYEGKVTDYNQLEKDHNDLSGALPWYIIIAIIGTFLFTYIYVRRKTVFEPQTEATDEITTGYGKIHSSIDRHILSHFRKEPETDEGRIEEIKEWKESPVETQKDEFTPDEKEKIEKSLEDAKKGRITPLKVEEKDDILTIVHEKIDANTRMMTEQFTTMLTDLDKKIDKVISERA